MNGMVFGFAFGLMIAAVVCVLIFKFANKDGKVKSEYDERQKTVRGKAYMISFYAEVFAQTALMMFFMSGIELPVENYVLVFAAIILGCTVLAVYCIWNDVYWGLNNDHKKYHIVFVIALIINAFPLIGAYRGGSLKMGGKYGLPMLNLIVIAMMAVVYATLLIKKVKDKETAGED